MSFFHHVRLQFVDEALDALIAVRKAIVTAQVLVDGYPIAATLHGGLNQLAIGLALA